jgi:acetate---CoA ligase (ADP-forming)
LLRGFRGAPALDVAAAADVLYRLGRLVQENPLIAEVEINPLVAYPKGRGTLALDALISVIGPRE